MILEQPENVAAHFFWIAVPIILSLGAGQWLSYRASKHTREEEAKKVADAIGKRDERLLYVLGEYVPHSHVDEVGETLTEPNIRYPKIKLEDK